LEQEEQHTTFNQFHTMNTDIHSRSSNQLPESAREIAQQATVAAHNVTGVVENMVKDTYQTMLSKVEEDVDLTKGCARKAVDATKETLATSKEYVRRNPVPVVLGAVAFGVAAGYMLMLALRKQTFGERYVDEPLVAVREAFLGALAPVEQGVHKGYDSARHGAEKAMDRVQSFVPERIGGSLSHQIGRIGNNLKFW
jgi:ElaB/YqjD/DUF883 family membrane-anchored ribosome-binding protein